MFKLKYMSKIKSVSELADMRVKLCKGRVNSNPENSFTRILVCGGTGCHASSSVQIIESLRAEIDILDLKDQVEVVQTGCFGFCEKGPIVKIMPDKTFYVSVTPDDSVDIIHKHIVLGEKVERLLYVDPSNDKCIEDSDHMSFYKKQKRVALSNCGVIDPENIDESIAAGGYSAIAKCLTMTPSEVIAEIKNSGLRGRGGAGFPTGLKWEIASKVAVKDGENKYVVCNADEGDPGAFMDRSIMEGDPNRILEGMAICGYAIGASKGLIYIRAEYPLAIHRLLIAIRSAKEYGLLGSNVLGSDFSFDIELKYGAGAFVCGEETALIHSMEGKRGEPTIKPPFPAVKGYLDQSTTVNNVETLANIAPIIDKGSVWFSSIGTEKSKGTKVFALAGKINNVGLIEVPMGTTLREVIYDIGGGIKGGKKFKAAQTGGPSGGCLTEKHLDTKIDFDSLLAVGSMMGSGGMIVMDESDCMVDVAKFYLEFTVDESCGKCAPCRIGNKRLLELLKSITDGKATLEEFEQLQNLAYVIKDTSLCGLGQTAPNPILSTIANFKDEYLEHITDKRCRCNKCKSLLRYTIDAEKCIGCTSCAINCPVGAIDGERKKVHVINLDICIRCGVCMTKCKFGAVNIK